MSPRRRWGLFLSALLPAAVLMVPLQVLADWALPAHGIAAREIAGSVWQGHLRGARWQGYAMGDLSLALQPWALAGGTRAFLVRGDTVALRVLQGRRTGFDGLQGELRALPVPGLPALRADLRFADTAVVFVQGRCAEAGGRVEVALHLPGREQDPMLLAGTAECAERAAVLPLRPQDGAARVDAELQVRADGSFRLQARGADADPAAVALLLRSGFVEAPGGLSLSLDGNIAD